MPEPRFNETFEQGDSSPAERLIESVEVPTTISAPLVEFVGYDLDGNEIRYNQDGTPTNP